MPDRIVPRRRDRSRDEAWIEAYLQAAPWGVLALPTGEGPPQVNSNLFVYRSDPPRIYIHTARAGALPEALDTSQGVPGTFTASEMGRLLPAPEALEFSVEYSGVVATGMVHMVWDQGEAEAVLQHLLDKYAPHLRPGVDYRPITPDELKRTAVYRMDVEGWSGKEKAVAEHPGSFLLERVGFPFRAGEGPAPGTGEAG